MNVSAASLFSSTEVSSPEFSSSRVVTSTNLYPFVTVFTLSSVASLDASTGAGVSVTASPAAGTGVSSTTGCTVGTGVASTTSGVDSGVDSTISGVGSGVDSTTLSSTGAGVSLGVSSTSCTSTISTVSGEDEPSTLVSSAFTEEKCTQVKTISVESVSLVNLDNLIFFFLFFMLCSPFLVYFLKFCCHQLELIYH